MGVHNDSNGDDKYYFKSVQDWPKAQRWRRTLSFGSGDSSVGQTYTVTTIVVDKATLDATLASHHSKNHSWRDSAFPARAKTVNSMTLKRIAGPGTKC